MARIKGVDIPNDKVIEISLTYVYGIGRSSAKKILETCKIDGAKRTKDLTNDELKAINDEISNYMIEGDLRREVNMSIKTKMEIGSYEGIRHRRGLPVRGQRTGRNARTWKNKKGPRKVVANKKKVG